MKTKLFILFILIIIFTGLTTLKTSTIVIKDEQSVGVEEVLQKFVKKTHFIDVSKSDATTKITFFGYSDKIYNKSRLLVSEIYEHLEARNLESIAKRDRTIAQHEAKLSQLHSQILGMLSVELYSGVVLEKLLNSNGNFNQSAFSKNSVNSDFAKILNDPHSLQFLKKIEQVGVESRLLESLIEDLKKDLIKIRKANQKHFNSIEILVL